MMKKRAFVVSMGLSAMLGVGACDIDTLIRDLAGGLNLGSSILGSGGLSVAGACSTFSDGDVEFGRTEMQDLRNAGYSMQEAQAEIVNRCQAPDMPYSFGDCIACGNAIAGEVYYGF